MTAEGADQPTTPAGANAEPVGFVDVTELLTVSVHQADDAAWVIQIAGELDMLTGPHLHDHLSKLLAAQPERLIIDLNQISFMGSTGLSVLITAKQTADEQGTKLQLRGTNQRAVARPLETTGLNHLFDTVPPLTDDC
jgi:anti-sigma B factor antagonist